MTNKEPIIIDGVDVSRCKHHRKCILPDNIGCKIDDFLCCDKPNCNYKQLVRKTQIINEAEEVIKPYQEQIELDALSLPIAIESILERKTQECEELKIKLIQKDEVNMFFNTPIEGWDNDPCKICESKNNYEQLKEDYAELEQECEKLSILAQEESARNGYVEYELNDKLKQKTQECENLKAEEKYLKQCCQKAGEELAKHSFEYDGKEKNLVVQAMELNEKYEKLKKALDEIEKILKDEICEECPGKEGCKAGCKEHQCLDIINKAKDINVPHKKDGE